MNNQSYNFVPLEETQSQNNISIQMIPEQKQIPQHTYIQYNQPPNPQFIGQQNHHPPQQQYQQNIQYMNQPQMYPQQHGCQQQFYMVPSNTIQYQNQPTSRYSQPLFCSNCQRIVPSIVQFKPGKGALVSGALIGLLGCWMGCCLIPCCNEDFQDAVHTCVICAQNLGKKQFLFS